MRRRNRKKTVNAYALPVPLAGFVVLAASVALVYVWMVCRCQTLGNDLKQLEVQRDDLRKRYQEEVSNWTRLKSPENLERALEHHQLNMTWPSSRQVVRLRRMAPDGIDTATKTEVASLARDGEVAE